MEKLPISLVVITLNEEKNIERCLKSAPFVSDIVVLDSGSRDQTRGKAEALGARVFEEKFRGFREQKQRATDLAKFDWILSLDADEALSDELKNEINLRFSKSPSCDAFKTPRLSYHLGRWIRNGGWFPDYQIRIFNRNSSRWVGGHVHERVEAERIETLTSPIHHWVFKDLADQVDTNNEYSTKGALDLLDKKKKFGLGLLVLKPVSKFLETFIWKRGFLDGMAGFIISVGAAYSVFLKYAKLWEIEKLNK